jgi:hypothetical protein
VHSGEIRFVTMETFLIEKTSPAILFWIKKPDIRTEHLFPFKNSCFHFPSYSF